MKAFGIEVTCNPRPAFFGAAFEIQVIRALSWLRGASIRVYIMANTQRAVRVSGSVCFVAMLGTCCVPGSGSSGQIPGATSNKPASTDHVGSVQTIDGNRGQRNGSAAVAKPMQGEPDDAALEQARLVTISCEQLEREATQEQQRLIDEMRHGIAAELQAWRAEQPQCWEEYSRAARGNMWGDEMGDSFGAGGLGLSGIGEGGGGTGEGIGLGSIGTLGHGAGVGTGQGFGSGHGGLGGSHATRAPHLASSTNNQVQGVDEADIVKNDGDFLYLVVNGALRIVATARPHLVSVTKLPGQPREMYIEGDRAAVYVSHGTSSRPRCTYGYDCQFTGDGTQTSLLIYDIKERSRPMLARRVDFSGSLLASRRVGPMVHTVVTNGDERSNAYYSTWPDDLPRCGVYEAAVRTQLQRLQQKNEQLIRQATQLKLPTITDNGVKRKFCGSVYRTAIVEKEAFTSLVSLNMKQDGLATRDATIQSSPGAVFATAGEFYLAATHQANNGQTGWYSFYTSSSEVTDLHRFSIGPRPDATKYSGSGVVPGHVLNQFSMDEWNGNLRIATTRGRVPNPDVESLVSVMSPTPAGNLVRVGAVEHLAPGEDIRSVRFEADRGYVVTFKKTDPLFVLDLKRPDAPKLLGELKIPGFSTYMHRIDDNHLLSIGFDANDHGSFAYFDGVILQLFDVTNPLRPKLMFKEKIGTRGSSSEAATNHLAFNYFAERGLLALPMTICEGGGDGLNGDHLSFGGLLVYDVSMKKGFQRLGGVNHGTVGQSCNTWWSQANSGVKRSVFIDDLVFSIAMDRIKVQKLEKLGKDLADIRLL